MLGREPTSGPVERAVDRQSAGIRKNDEGRQILIAGTEAVGEPRTKARSVGGKWMSAVSDAQGRLVTDRFRRHRANERDLVRDACDVRNDLRQSHPALAVRLKLERRAKLFPEADGDNVSTLLCPGYGLPLSFTSSGFSSKRSI